MRVFNFNTFHSLSRNFSHSIVNFNASCPKFSILITYIDIPFLQEFFPKRRAKKLEKNIFRSLKNYDGRATRKKLIRDKTREKSGMASILRILSSLLVTLSARHIYEYLTHTWKYFKRMDTVVHPLNARPPRGTNGE